MYQFLLFLLVILSYPCLFDSHSLQPINSSTNITFSICLPHQSSILLQLKNEFMLIKRQGYHYIHYYHYDDDDGDILKNSYPKMKSWKGGSDCCWWDGVSCDMATGHVISLDLSGSWLHGPLRSNSSLFRLLHLRKLNLAFNNFTSCRIPLEFGQLSRLTHLNLSESKFSGHIPISEISWLPNLISLDLSFNFGLSYLRGAELGRVLIQNMTNLRQLHLDWANLSSPVPIHLANLSFMTHLSFDGCNLHGEFPNDIFHLPNIQFISFSSNPQLSGSLPEFSSGSMLKVLDLSHTNFSGKLPNSIANLKSLKILMLGYCSFSGIVPPSLRYLTGLRRLDLQDNGFSGQIPSSLGNLTQLEELILERNDLTGSIPISLPHRIKYLSFSENHLTGSIPISLPHRIKYLSFSENHLTGSIPSSLGNLTQLEELILESNDLTGSIPISLPHRIKSLSFLENHLTGSIPSSLGNLTQLEVLILESNDLTGSISISLPHRIKYLFFSRNHLTGSIPISLPHRIKYISFSENHLTGSIPSSLGNLTQLEELILESNDLTGSIPSIISNLTFLSTLFLSSNSLTGVIPGCLLKMPSLKELILYNNQFTGHLNIQNVSNSSELETLWLSGNKLSGQIPSSLFKFTKLRLVYLDSNDFSGRLDFGIFSKLSSISGLDLSNNRGLFITNLSMKSIPHDKFQGIYLSSCNIGEFPAFLKTQDELEYLDLSNNNIRDPIPKWLLSVGTETLRDLNLSHNFISGWEEAPSILSWKEMKSLDLHSNALHGSLVLPPMSTSYFSISENRLVGRIDPLLCKMRYLGYLDLSGNKLSGTIPQCLGNFSSSLIVLNLRRNNLSGTMPRTCGNTNQLQTLDLSYNNLHGKIPKSLIKCKELQILNLGGNQMADTFPFMVQSLSKLQVLILSSNKFYGPIWHPHTFFGFVNLSIIDLSFNNFTGSLPSDYFRNWTSMKASYNKSQSKYIGDNDYFRDLYSVTLVNKGLEMLYVKILTFFVSIDFSNNKFYGEMPKTIGDIRDLVVLNLSSNNFTGSIPPSLGNLIELESLDLSKNKLSGEIPEQLTSLTFLGYLNLSENKLVGPIPQARQIGIFSNSSFQGNWGLCGPPLSKSCGTPLPPSHYSEKSSDDSILSGFTWESVAIGYGCGTIIGLIIGYIIMSRNPYLVFKIFRVIPPRRRLKRSRSKRVARISR